MTRRFMDKVIDSQGVVELVVFLQERFAITVEDDEVTTKISIP